MVSSTLDAIDVYGANITGCRMILGLSWLRQVSPDINWGNNTVCYLPAALRDFPEEAAAIRSRVSGPRCDGVEW